MFNSSNGPISIIYQFIPIDMIYLEHLNILNREIYKMISRDIHHRDKSKKISISYINDMIANVFVVGSKLNNILICINYSWIKQNKFEYILLKLLKDKRVDPSVDQDKCFRLSSKYGFSNIVQYLLKDKRVDLNVGYGKVELYVRHNCAFIDAVHGNHIEIVQMLLKDKRIDLYMNARGIIGDASQRGYYEMVKLLLKNKKIDPVLQDAIFRASDKGHLNIVKRLLKDFRIDPNEDNNFAIGCASDSGYTEIVELLLKDKRKLSFDNVGTIPDYGSIHNYTNKIDHYYDDRTENISIEDIQKQIKKIKKTSL